MPHFLRSSNRPRRAIGAAMIMMLTVVVTPSSTTAELPDYSTSTNLDAGAYIIDMGVTPQTVENGLQPYGLVYDLAINNQIPVLWAIDSTKAREGVDFSYDGKDYSGGPFIIAAEYAADAGPIIANWQAQAPGMVVDGPTITPIDVPAYERITAWPNAVLDAKNGGIAAAYYANAGIPSSNYREGLPSDLDDCDDIYIMPHADPEWDTHQNLVDWNDNDRGYIWAACHAVSVLENVADPTDPDPDPEMNFLSTNGLIDFGGHDDGSPPYSYSNDGGDPILQFLGVLDSAQQNGSEQIYLPALGSGWLPSTNLLGWDPDQSDVVAGDSHGEAASLIYGRGFGDETNGLVMYEGGHSHNKGDEPDLVAAQRAFFNLHLLAGIENGVQVDVTAPETIASGSTVPVSALIDGGSHDYDYTWTSSCSGGTFATPTGMIAGSGVTVNTTFTAPAGAQGCAVKLVVSDTCGRDAFGASGVEIVELTDLEVTKTDSVDPVNSGSDLVYTVTVNNLGPSAATNVALSDLLPPEVTYLSSVPSQGTCALVGGSLECDLGAVGVGGTATVTVTVATDPAFEGTLTNTASVSADQADTNPTNDTAVETTEAGINGLELAKSADPSVVEASAVPVDIDFTFLASNTGVRPVTSVTVTDDQCSPVTYVSGDGNTNNELDPGETWEFSCTLIGLTSDIVNTASVSGTDALLGSISSPVATAAVDVIAPEIDITKSPAVQNAPEGGQAVFAITVENTGDVDLSHVFVTDPTAPSCDRYLPTLAVGATFTYDCFLDHGLTAGNSGTNTINVTSLDPGGDPVTDVATADYTAIASDLAITKTNDAAGDLYPGDPVTYTITVENTSAVVQNDVIVTDVLPPGITYVGPTTIEAPVLTSATVATDAFATNGDYTGGSGWYSNPPYSELVASATNDDPPTTWTVTTAGDRWFEREDAAANDGTVKVDGNLRLEMTASSKTVAIGAQQVLDLAGLSSASMSFSCDTTHFDSSDDLGYVYVNGAIVAYYTDGSNMAPGYTDCDPALAATSVNLDAYVGQEVAIGFGVTGNKRFAVDDVSVLGDAVAIAGSTFSTTQTYFGGTGQWAGLPWIEFADGVASSAGVNVTGNKLELAGAAAPRSANVSRSVDLTGKQTASLTFTCNTSAFDDNGTDFGYVRVNGTLERTYVESTSPGAGEEDCTATPGTRTVDLTSYVGAPVTIEFSASSDNNKKFVVDDVVVDATTFVITTTSGGTSPNLVTAGNDIDLPAGGIMTVTVPAEVDAALTPYYARQQVNTASTASVEQPAPISAGSLVDVVVSGLDIVKTADPAIASPGDPVTYTMVVTNTGNDPITPSVADPDCSPVSFDGGDANADTLLDLNETWTYSCATTSPPVTNTATVTGLDTNGVAVPQASDSATIDLVDSDISIAVATTTPVIRPGETASYTYDVTTGGANEPLSAVTVVDDTCSPVAPVLSAGFNVGDTNTDGALDDGETWQFGCSTTLSTSTTNTATATGTDRAGADQTDVDSTSVDVIQPAIALAATALQNNTNPGDPVTYEYTVTNPGDDPLSTVAIGSDQCSPSYASGDTNLDNLLDPSETWVYDCTTNPTADVTNFATAEGTDSLGLTWTADDSVAVNVVTPSISVGKVADGTVVYSPYFATYTYTVYNDGDTIFDAVNVGDDVCAGVVRGGDLVGDGDNLLELGEAWSYTCTQVLGVTTTNTFTADALVGGSVLASGAATELVTVLDPTLGVTTTADVATLPVGGGSVTYTYEVTNTSPGTSTFHYITPALPTDDTCGPLVYVGGDDGDGQIGFDEVTGLSEVWTYSCATTITEDTTNTVTATGTDVRSNPVPDATAQDFVDILPDVTATKTANPTLVKASGDDVTFTYRVDNASTESVDVTVLNDDIYGDLNGQGTCSTPQTIAAGGFYECTITVNVSGPAGGSETSVLTVTANDDEGNVVNPTASAVVDFGDVVIGDFVWTDLDWDGVQDPGEPGRDGVTVNLYTSGDGLVATTVTAGGGLYQFDGQVPGDYYLEFVEAGASFGPADQDGDDTLDSDVTDLGAGTTDVFTVVAGETNNDLDASILAPPAVVSGLVWLDADDDQTNAADPADPAVPGVTVTLLESDGITPVAGVPSVVTDGSGAYSFDVQPGDYRVEFSGLPGATYVDSGTDSDVDSTGLSPTITFVSGANPAVNGGIVPAVIGDRVFLDQNGNGLDDAEPGIENVTATLSNAGGTVGTATTDNTGAYSFSVLPGDYTVTVARADTTWTTQDVGAGANEATDSDVDPSTGSTGSLSFASGVNTDLADAGAAPGSFTSTVWLDENADGVFDGTESGIEGVSVTLDDGVNPVLTATTDSNGEFTFAGLLPGDFDVQVVYPGATFSPTGADSDVTDGPTGGAIAGLTIQSGAFTAIADAGVEPAIISDLVWDDLNGNGVQNGEPGLDGALVQATGGPVTKVYNAFTTAGAYSLAVPPGDYTVAFLAPLGYVPTLQDQGLDTADSDIDGAAGITLTGLTSGTDATIDAGFYVPVDLDGTVWNDVDGSQTINGELGIVGVDVTLDDGVNAPVTIQTTVAGVYDFGAIPPGDYTITVGPAGVPGGYVSTTSNSPASITVVSNTPQAGPDFGYAALATVGDRVFLDLNGNGQDDAEPGVSGLTVTLTGGPSPVTDVTDGSGNYSFAVVPGDYTATVTPPTGGSFVTAGLGAEGVDSDVDAGGSTGVVTFPSGDNTDLADAGIAPAVISSTVWFDEDGDGDQAGPLEPGLENVTVQLFPAGGATAIETVTTDASGVFSFGPVEPGNYDIVVVFPEASFSPTGADSDVTPGPAATGGGQALNVAVSSGSNDVADAGVLPAELTSTVWLDVDLNGVQDLPGDVGIGGVTVNVSDAAGNVVPATTNGSGVFNATGLVPGAASAQVVYPDATFVTGVGDSDIDAAGLAAPLTLSSGTNSALADAPVEPAVVAGNVFLDISGNDLDDAEPGLEGLTVTLTDGANPAQVTTTDVNGNYSFLAVPGNNTVTVAPPAGGSFVAEGDGSSEATDSDVDATSGAVTGTFVSGANNADLADAGIVPASIDSTVFLDLDGDGSLDTVDGEAGIPAITVELFDTSGAVPVSLGTDTTNGTGDFSFTGLEPGAPYEVVVQYPEAEFSPNGPESDVTPGLSTAGGGVAAVTPGSGSNDVAGAGVLPAQLTSTVWVDQDGNGVQDLPADTGVAGVTVNVTDAAGNVVPAVTNPAGVFTATGLVPGTASAQVVYPEATFITIGDSDVSVTGAAGPLSLSSGANVALADAPVEPAIIGDLVFLDVNDDGDQSGEPGVAGVTVMLLQSGVPVGAPAVTGAAGDYQFSVAPGDYTVVVTAPTGASFTTLTAAEAVDSDVDGSGSTGSTTFSSGDNRDLADAGFEPATLTSSVWLDANDNGVRDPSDPTLEGVDVIVTDGLGTPVTVTTGAGGVYTVPGLMPGDVDVDVDYDAADFVPVGVDSDVAPATGDVTVALGSGTNTGVTDAGVVPAIISDFAWDDLNGSGVQGGTEPGLDGVVVDAAGGPGGATYSNTSSAGGAYSVAVAPGDYVVTYTPPSGYVPTLVDQGDDAFDSDVTAAGTISLPGLTSGSDDSIDAGFYQPVSVAGFVWNDADGSQTVTGAEAGLGDIAVTATHVPTGGTFAVSTDTGATVGVYSLTNLPPGDYTIDVDEADVDLPAGYALTTADPISVPLPGGTTATAQNFGFAAAALIGDRVFLDVNGNGQDDGEPGVAGLTVTLTGGPSLVTDVTDGNGNYSFSVMPGDYTVTVTPPAGGSFVAAGSGGEAVDSDVNAAGSTGVVTFSSGDNTDLADAGIEPSVIASTVWLDVDGDGDQAGPLEVGLENVTVRLFPSGGTTAIETVTTDANGDFTFAPVEMGDYDIVVVYAGASFSPTGGDSDVTPGPAATGGGQVLDVAVSSGSNDVADAGVLPAELTSTVWLDQDGDGVENGTDTGVPGVDVDVIDGAGNTVTVTSNGSGVFTATGLVPGSGSAQVVYPEATFITIGDSDVTATGLVSPVSLASGSNVALADAPVEPAIIGDLVFLDTDDDGDQSGEPGVAGVTVTLLQSGVPVGTPVVTGSAGDYQFSVAPGTYEVVVTAPAGADFVAQGAGSATDSDVDGAGSTGDVVFDSGDNGDLADAGFEPATLTSTVWLDANDNGVQDPSDPTLIGVDVIVTDARGVPVTVTTSAGGVYIAPGLLPGDVDVDVVYDLASFVPVGADSAVAPATGDVTVVLSSGANTGVADAGVVPAIISDFAWDDLNGNGVQDSGEPGLDAVAVSAVGGPGGATYSDTSAAGGAYLVAVAPGDYVVTYTAPVGYVSTQQDQGDDAFDSDVSAAGTITFTGLTSGTDDAVDAGFYVPVQVTGAVWDDVDGSQTNNGEAGLVGVDVTLDDGVDPPITVQTTAGGVYDFGTLPPGDYTIVVGPAGIPAGYVSTTNNVPAPVTLVSNTPQAGPDFGYAAQAIIGDRVFLDVNGNGQDDAEPGVVGVTVTLLDDGGVQVGVPVVTDSNGNYTFPGVMPGDYEVRVSGLPASFSPQDVGAEATDSDVDPVTGSTGVVNFPSGDQTDLGDAGVLPAVLNSNVFLDVDGDGTIDPEDVGIEGVTVEIYDAGGALAGSAVTDPNGDYTIGGLVPGDYDVRVVYTDAVFSNGTDSDVDPTGVVSVTLSSNDNDDVADAGVLPAVTGDFVWVDTDGDGIQGGTEPGLDAVGVVASSVATGQTFSTSSNPDGSYALSTPPGDFVVVYTPPVGYVVTQSGAGGDTALDSDIDPTTSDVTLTGLVSGTTDDSVDAGFSLPVTISGTVWDDVDGDQAIDGTEVGIGTVTVTAVNATNGVTYPAVTVADGTFSFTGLAPGDYTITVTEGDLPAGYLSTTANNPETLTTVSDDDVADLDFGYAAPVTIGGDAWLDLNEDGIQDLGVEPARPGVNVDLYLSGGTFVATTTTAVDGSYSFPGELPGEYYLEFSDPLAETTFGDPFQGGDPALDSDVTDPANGRTDTFLIVGGTVEDTIDVSIIAQPPVANDDGPIVIEIDTTTPTTIDAVGNDTDPEDDIVATTANITCPGCSDVTNGTLVNVGDGTFTYVPTPGYSGPDSFVYEMCDSTGRCDTATVTIDVNDLPVVDDDTADTTENTPVVIDVVDNDSDPDGLDPSTVTIVTPPANGTTSVDPTTGDVTYTPNDAFDGTDTFEYQVCDVLGSCETATVTVTVDGTPTAVDDEADTLEDTPVTIDVIDNDTDVDGIDPTTVTVDPQPDNGSTTVNPVTGEVTYAPELGFIGVERFVYEVCDNDGDCASASVTVTVDPTWTVSGQVWLDDDRDGVIDVGENDISGVRLVLNGPGDDGVIGTSDDVELDEAFTASPYEFTGLLDGQYQITVDTTSLPTGLGITFDVDGGSDGLAIITVAGADVVVEQDFAYAYPALSGTMSDSNGVAVGGAQISFVDAGGNTFTTITAADGGYLLESGPGREFAFGVGTLTVRWPNGTTSTATVTIIGAQVTVQDLTSPAVTGDIPTTGANTGTLVKLSTLIMLIGIGLFLAGRRRRSTLSAASS